MKYLQTVLFAVMLMSFSVPSHKKIRIFMAGDSTMQPYNTQKTPQRGWGQVLHRFFNDRVQIINKARGGRSTKSFIKEGLWQSLVDSLQPGDWVFIEFGHNDHDRRKPERYTPPEDYKKNLEKEVRAKDAFPVLFTPIAMRTFDSAGHYHDGHGPYPGKVRQAAHELKVPLIDLDAAFGKVISRMGPVQSRELFMNFDAGRYPAYPDGRTDNTHLREKGALTVAKLAVQGMKEERLIPLVKNLSLGMPSSITPSSSVQNKKAPIMGWSSWNNFRVHIDEKMIREQADAMIASGLYDAGYRFINIDDGYFGGRDSSGKLDVDAKKFPSGMRSLVDYIHSKNLKAGIYTDAGRNTCGSIYDKDQNGIGSGIYGHIQQDCDLFFKEWGFDFIKVDWCGGKQMGLDEETEYTRIINAVKAIDSNIVFNICRWKFPGVWAIKKADSWRISGDIRASFSSILKIIDLDASLYKYASAGHYNDMDMLQVGRGMSYDEDKTHFSMWCMLNSPLLAGNDLRKMSKETIEILTNKEVIALNQDPGFKQATRVYRENNIDVWVKPLGIEKGKSEAIAIMNRGSRDTTFTLVAKRLKIGKKTRLRDLWQHKDLGKIGKRIKFTIPKHGIVVLKAELH